MSEKELIEALQDWAKEDLDGRALFIVSGSCGYANLVCSGNERNLLRALIATILDDDNTQELLIAALDGAKTIKETKSILFKE